MKELLNRAKTGDMEAEFEVGNAYFYGKGVKKAYLESVKWYKLAAEKGHAEAQFALGYCYFHSLGIKYKNGKEMGVELFEKAMDKGCVRAIAQLGVYHYFKNYTDEMDDLSRGLSLLKWASQLGNSNAQCFLAYCYKEGKGINKDMEKAYELYFKSAKAGNNAAMSALRLNFDFAIRPEVEKLIEEDAEKHGGKDWKEYAKAGDAAMQAELAERYYAGGYGKFTKPKLAFKWAKAGAEQGDPLAQYILSELYRENKVYDNKGNLIERYHGNKMRKLLYMSAEQGYSQAIRRQAAFVVFDREVDAAFNRFVHEFSTIPKKERDEFFARQELSDSKPFEYWYDEDVEEYGEGVK